MKGVIKCLNDAKRGLQFIRYYSDDLQIDPRTKIALQGSSAERIRASNFA